jgi:ligand-binding SRPBCC domain-containing protein
MCAFKKNSKFESKQIKNAIGVLLLQTTHTMFHIKTEQKFPIGLEEAWKFFSTPSNLEAVTPQGIGFKILSELPDEMYVGMILRYKVAPILGIPVNWATEITHITPYQYFVDHQLEGPFKTWHHQHHFKAIPGGVLVTDIVHYALPLGIVGKWAHPLVVQQKLNEIFAFRKKSLTNVFGSFEGE